MESCNCVHVQGASLPICQELSTDFNRIVNEQVDRIDQVVMPLIDAWKQLGVAHMELRHLPKCKVEELPEGITQEALDAEVALRLSHRVAGRVQHVALQHLQCGGNRIYLNLGVEEEEREAGAHRLATQLAGEVAESVRSGTIQQMLDIQDWVRTRLNDVAKEVMAKAELSLDTRADTFHVAKNLSAQFDAVGEEVLTPLQRVLWRVSNLKLRLKGYDQLPRGLTRVTMGWEGWKGFAKG